MSTRWCFRHSCPSSDSYHPYVPPSMVSSGSWRRDTCTSMFGAAFLIVDRRWTQSDVQPLLIFSLQWIHLSLYFSQENSDSHWIPTLCWLRNVLNLDNHLLPLISNTLKCPWGAGCWSAKLILNETWVRQSYCLQYTKEDRHVYLSK